MHKSERVKGSLDWRKGLLGAVAIAGLALAIYPDAFARNHEVKDLVELIETQPARHRKLMALRELAQLDNRDARVAIQHLAESDDEVTAMAAIVTMSREDFSGARKALVDIVEDGNRSDAVRSTALGACMKHRKDDREAWSDARGWVKAKSKDDTKLDAFAKAYSKHLWGSEVSDE